MKKIQEANLFNKKVILRVDFNVAVKDGKVKEGFKIEAAKETLNYLLEKKCKVAMVSHFGRPEGKINPELSLRQIKNDIENILETKIFFIGDCLSEEIKNKLNDLSANEILLLENVRFYEGEESNEKDFARKLANNFDVFINDAFSVSHRDQASVTGITNFLPSFSGLRLQKEIEEMEKIKNNFEKPAIAIIGGAKIETKLPVINFFENKYDHILVGGKIANEALDKKIEFSDKVILPIDFVDDRLDIGPKTLEIFEEFIKSSKTIVWNGPTGKFEEKKYSVSSDKILQTILESKAYVVIGGGETLEILEKKNALNKVNFVSTGGGAMLDYLGGNKMPGIEALK
ncbi:MAG TPA: phosphoglycerate kinase [Candidatus Moranbacteria bacterium]|nr:phosphoglycerate kinase [Candidatus Moranbacteria bacterium]HRZ33303.1 phosphoglycerate kinase [Candidatus Moranbacteria bacterium]